jgi:hypothetical protein
VRLSIAERREAVTELAAEVATFPRGGGCDISTALRSLLGSQLTEGVPKTT